jgi:hypothetical protein
MNHHAWPCSEFLSLFSESSSSWSWESTTSRGRQKLGKVLGLFFWHWGFNSGPTPWAALPSLFL